MNDELKIIEVDRHGEGERILRLVGPLTITSMFDFRDRLRNETEAKAIILDFSEVPYVDSAGVGAIVNGHVSCVNSGRRLALANVVTRVRTLLRVTHVDTVLTICPTVADAQRVLAAHVSS